MDTNQSSRKRKQPPANPLAGIVTRKKAQIFIHRNRSGKSRLDPLPNPDFHLTGRKSSVNPDLSISKDSVARQGLNSANPPSSMLAICDSAGKKPNLTGKKPNSSRCDIGADFKEDKDKFNMGLACIGKIADNLIPNTSDRDLKRANGQNFEGFTHEIESVWQNQNSFSRSPTKVMKPCYRLRVFKAPNYFTHRRRLLPITNDRCAPYVNPCPKNDAEAVENLELDDVLLTMQPCLSSREVSLNRSDEGKLSLVHKGCELEIEQAVDDQTALNCNATLQDASTIAKLDQSDSKTYGNVDSPCQSLVQAETEGRTAHVELKMDESSICVVQSSMKHEAIVSSRFHAARLFKGIFRRNSPGCRGICDCIYCASFRSNARAFDFSRNQMLDFEKLFLDMRKELSKPSSFVSKLCCLWQQQPCYVTS